MSEARPPGRRIRRLWIALAVVAALLVALRVALPSIARSQLEQQLSALLAGKVTVGDVDLWLTSGAVAAKDVALRPDDAGPDAPPLVAFQRLAIDIAWLGLFQHTARVEDVTLTGLEVHVERLADGALVLPGLRQSPAAAEPPPPAPEPAGSSEPEAEPWAVFVDHVALVGGELEVRDHVVEPVESRVVRLPTLEARNLAFQPRPDGGAGTGALNIRIDEGEIDLRTRIVPRKEGLAVSAVLRVTDVPLSRLHVHAPDLGWSDSKGFLSLEARARIAPDGMPRVHGSVTLRDLEADVAGEKRSAFAAKRLAVTMKRFSLLDRVADVTSVELEGAQLVVYPLAEQPLPLLRGKGGKAKAGGGAKPGGGAPKPAERDVAAKGTAAPAAAEAPAPVAKAASPTKEGAEAAAPSPRSEPAGEAPPNAEPTAAAPAGDTAVPTATTPPAAEATGTTVPDAETTATTVAAAEPAAKTVPAAQPTAATLPIKDAATDEPVKAPPPKAVPEAPPKPWRWRVDEVTLTDATVHVGFEREMLDVGIPRVVVKGASSDFTKPLDVEAALAVSDGTLTSKGTVVIEPLSAKLDLTAAGIGVGRLAGATGMAPVAIDGAALDAQLALAFGTGPLSLVGKVSLADVEMTIPDEDGFSASWGDLAIGIKSLEMPGVLDASAPPSKAPVALRLEEIKFASPRLVLTRRAEGMVLPGGGKAADAEATEAAAAKKAEPVPATAAKTAPPAAIITLARFQLDDGEIVWNDEAIDPPYEGTFDAIDLTVTGLEYPATTVGSVRLSLKDEHGGTVKIAGTRKGNDIALTCDVDGLELPQFNPYVQASGYGLREGKLTLATKADLAARGFDITNKIDLDDLQLGGAGTDAFFADSVGIPTSVALGLLKDTQGRISLDIPLGGSREKGIAVKVGPIIAQALTKAIVGALASPLKLLGAVTVGDDGKIQGVQPSPIAFESGSVDVSEKTQEKLVVLGKGLGLSKSFSLTLTGQASAKDRLAKQQAAVLADLEKPRGFFGRVRNLGSGEEREAIKQALVARADGKQGTLPPEQQATLDEWVAEKSVSDDELRTLARERAEKVRAVLVAEGIAAERIKVEEPVLDAPKSSVTVALAQEK